ncbi:LysR family transcriptional regulator [Gallaecimonas kandeliae]|uniref:LysR family transcriptional regulator n=1 Tax=Gallaecimonas kandeliae TaxID=3029055 RepID=UPI002647024B|nr:LysR family transcriptional regulator [Gallaecimonas kandeliae]WKE64106.1 LysR family transcriptional regulator [Gallaecimonas kandeliae]
MNLLSAMEAFVKVAECGSYTRAAEQLDISRTQLSKLVLQLEEHLKVRLLQRTTRRLHLTEAGEHYLARAQGILQSIGEAEAELGQGLDQVRGRLRINGPMSFGTRHLSPLVARFMAQHPELEVRLDLNDRRVDLLEEGYDLAIRIGTLPDSSLVARQLTQCRMLLCAAPAYIAAKGEPQSVDDLAGHQCLKYRGSGGSTHWQLGDRTLTVDGPLESNNGEVLTHVAEAGLGIAFQPSFLVEDSIHSGRLRVLLAGQLDRRLGVYGIYPARRHLPAKVSLFLDFLAESWGNPPYWEKDIISK